jgi:hypothetical protein
MDNPARILTAEELRRLLVHVDHGLLSKRNTYVVLLSL